MPRLKRLAKTMALLASLAGIAAIGVRADQAPALAAQAQTAPADQQPTPGTVPDQPQPQELHLLVGHSLVITSPTRIKRISLADPTIAEAIVVSPTEVLVNGKAPGGVSLLIWDESDQSQIFEVSVDIDVMGLTQKIHEVFPAEPVQVETSKDVVMLSGKVSSAAVADKILEVVKGAAPKVTSLMQVPPVGQGEVLLEVKFAEVDITKLNELGFNFLRNFGTNLPASISTQQYSPFGLTQTGNTIGGNEFTISSLLNVALFDPALNLGATIQALQNNNVLEILAEPNLMTTSGKEANFLAGGEFPFPVIQSAGGTGTLPAITIQFKEFGVRLAFTPTIAPDGTIHMSVSPEVSALDFSNALTIQGFTIPALSTRRVQSDMDLRDGQSFAIAGLIDNRDTELMSKIPGIGDVPVLGQFFRSKSVTKSKDELLVLVTPRIVQPLAPNNLPAGPTFPKSFLEETPKPSAPAAK